MKVDGVDISDSQRMRLLADIEHEGSIVTPPLDPVAEVERLCAADMIVSMRRIRALAPQWDEMSREKFARRLEGLCLEIDAAIAYLRRHRANTDVPEWLRERGAM